MTEKRFDGQVAIVTGAGGGMGREHALLLASKGASVVVNDISENAEETVKLIERAGGRAVPNHGDVSSQTGADSIVQEALDTFGRLDILVSNAGIIKNVHFSDMTLEEFDRVMKVNAYGAFNVTKAAWSQFTKQNYGRIVLVSSSSAYVSQPLISHYAASKGAVLGLGKTLAVEAEDYDVKVNMIMPGAFTAMSGNMEDEEARKLSEKMMKASLVAPIVAWLCHKDNDLNGQIIEAAAGRAALNFIGSTKGYWNEELTVEDLFENHEKVFEQDGFTVLSDTVKLASWMTVDNTGWKL